MGDRRGVHSGNQQWAEPGDDEPFIVVWLTVLPVAVYLIMGEPVGLLKTAGAIERLIFPW